MKFLSVFVGIALLVISWKLLLFSPTEKGKDVFKARLHDYYEKGIGDGLSVLNGVFVALILFVIGFVLILVGIISFFR
jgi:hypothetical protein